MSDLPLKHESEVKMSSYVTGRLSWLSRKVTTILFAVLFSAAALVFLSQQEQFVSTSPRDFSKVESIKPVELDCQGRDNVGSRELWNAAQEKFKHLSDEKFTIAIQTYKRPGNLNKTLNLILSTKIPSLEEVVIVWNDLQTPTPPNFVSRHNVTVRYRMSRRNSLNEKFWPDPAFRTKAILLSDDDVHYDPKDLDFVFQTWRKNQHRLVGAFARCIAYNKATKQLEYHFCQNRDSYSMILTGLAFTSISFLDYYSSDDLLMTKIRTFVDAKFNCEDIALNFIASMLTCEGPLQVSGLKRPINEMPPQGISTNPDHLNARNKCINDYTDFFGYIPLRNSTEYITRGYFPG